MVQVVPAPVNVRQMLLAFALYSAPSGLASLTDRIDFTGVTRRQIYFNTLGRPPGAAVALDGPGFNARAATLQALNGNEFQVRLREIVLGAFPDKRRLIFVQSPGWADGRLAAALARRAPALHEALCETKATAKPDLFRHLQQFAAGVELADSIALWGETPLHWYLDRNLVRFEDDVFTALRHPRDLAYATVSAQLAGAAVPDGAEVVSTADTEALTGGASAASGDRAALAGHYLRAATPNPLCHALGRGTATSALETMVHTDIEVTDEAHTPAWLRQRFGLLAASRTRPAARQFTPKTAGAANRALVEALIAEDMIVYDAVQARIGAGVSVRGRVFG